MSERAAQGPPAIDGFMSAERQPFLRANTVLGAIARSAARPGMMAPMILEEATWYADKKWRLTGLAAAGALLSEGLWVYQERMRREESERALSL